jgi:hypothetical protein
MALMEKTWNKPIQISGLWLRRIGVWAEVLVEIDGEWRLCIREVYDGCFSHIIEPDGIRKSPLDKLTKHELNAEAKP